MQVHLIGVQRRMPNSRLSFEVIGTWMSGNEQPSQSDMDNVAYICTLSYGTCWSFGSVYSFTFMYTADHIFPVLPIKYLINEDCDPITPYKIATGKKPSVLHLRVLFCPCVVRKPTAHVGKSHYICVTKHKSFFAVYSLEFHNTKKDILCVYQVQGR